MARVGAEAQPEQMAEKAHPFAEIGFAFAAMPLAKGKMNLGHAQRGAADEDFQQDFEAIRP